MTAHGRVAAELERLLAARARGLVPGDPLDPRTQLGAMANAESRDIVVALASPAREGPTETDLVDALRGHLDDLTVRVLRNGRQVDVHGRWPPGARCASARWWRGRMRGICGGDCYNYFEPVAVLPG